MTAFRCFGITQVGFPQDPSTVYSLVRGLGPALALRQQPPLYWCIAVGKFSDGFGDLDGEVNPSIRIGVSARDPRRIENNHIPTIQSALRSATTGIRFTELSSNRMWLDSIALRDDPRFRMSSTDLNLSFPLLSADVESSLWMDKFLQEVAASTARNMGVAILLRPTAKLDKKEAGRSNPWALLREYFERTPIESKTHSKQSRDGADSKGTSSSTTTLGAALRDRALGILDELISTQGWWLSMRAFGDDDSVAQRAAMAFWSALAPVVWDRVPQRDLSSRSHIPTISYSSDTYWEHLDAEKLELFGNGREIDSVFFKRMLKEQGIDLSFHTESLDDRVSFENDESNKGLASCRQMVLPKSNEQLISGKRLSTVFQLPARPNPMVMVERGFAYCKVPDIQTSRTSFRLGLVGRGGIIDDLETETPAYLETSNMTRHTLVVGATGSGKTSTLLTLLSAARKKQPKLGITILEGAKSEYREHKDFLGIADVYDFQNTFLPLHLFEHPDFVSPEEHINQVAAIFTATMDLPQPMPSIFKEALTQAYVDYHAASDHKVRLLHPVRYWLYKAANDLAIQMGYEGETQSNINGILRSRIGALARGTAGRILSGKGETEQGWEATYEGIQRSAILELEAVADPIARSLIMALFVLYFRYAVRQAGRASGGHHSPDHLQHLLVLEEAHRIIGRGHGGGQDISLEFFSNILSEIRSEGCGIIICDQSPSKLIDDAMRNTNTKIIMRLVSGEDIRVAVAGAGLPDEARFDITDLQTFEAIVTSPDQQPRFVRVDSPYKHVSRSNASKKHEGKKQTISAMRRRFEADQRIASVYFKTLKALPALSSQKFHAPGKKQSFFGPLKDVHESISHFSNKPLLFGDALRDDQIAFLRELGCDCQRDDIASCIHTLDNDFWAKAFVLLEEAALTWLKPS